MTLDEDAGMGNLAPCNHCGQTVARDAPTCPHCGGAHPAMSKAGAVRALLVLALTLAFLGGLAWFIHGLWNAMGGK